MRLRSEMGNISTIVGISIVGTLALYFSSLMVASKKVITKGSALEDSYQQSSEKLYQLLNLAWSDTALSSSISHPATAPSLAQWTVEDVGPRLKKITVTAPLQKNDASGRQVAETPMVTGYKYDDF